jgi:hypothetical protein
MALLMIDKNKYKFARWLCSEIRHALLESSPQRNGGGKDLQRNSRSAEFAVMCRCRGHCRKRGRRDWIDDLRDGLKQFWCEMKAQEEQNIQRLKDLIKQEVRNECF